MNIAEYVYTKLGEQGDGFGPQSAAKETLLPSR